MRRLVLSIALVAGLGAAPLALADEAAAPAAAPVKPAKDDPNRIVCTREHVVGSNRPKKVCMTAAQRDQIRDAARRELDEGRRTPGGAEITQQQGG